MEERGAIYSRISDDREGLEHGVVQQEADSLKRAKRDGVRIPTHRIYRENDVGASTRSKKPRPKYKALLKAIRDGEITVVYAYSNSRLTRRPMEMEELIQLHEATGVLFRTIVSGDDDLSTADGRMVARIKAAVDASLSEKISEQVSRHARARAEEGGENGGQRPYGWRQSDRRKLDRREHKVIKEAVKRVLAKESLSSIAADFNARGIATVTGVPWSISTLRSILINPRLAGQRTHLQAVVAKGNWEPAVTLLEHRRLTRILGDPDRYQGSGNARKYRLTGQAICSDCRTTVTLGVNAQKNRPKRLFYKCRTCGMLRKMEWVDTYTDGVMEGFLRGYKPKPPKQVDRKAAHEAERLRERIEETKTSFAESDVMSPAELADILRKLQRRLTALEVKAFPDGDEAAVLEGLTGENPAVAWLDLPLARQRAIIAMFFVVELHRGRPGIRVFDPDTVQFVPK